MTHYHTHPELTSDPAVPRLWVGLDVGGTKIEGLAVDEAGQVRGRALLPTDTTTGETTVASIEQAVRVVLAQASTPAVLSAIGLGIPGMVQDGVVSLAVHLNLTAFPLARHLSEIFGVPVYLENDVRAAALGAYAWVRQQRPETRSLVFLSLGTGISAGVILNGKLHRGENGMAGEVGHAIIDPNGARCRCGSTGCLETVAAGWGIAEQAGRALAEAQSAGQSSLLSQLQPLTAAGVFQAAGQGDPVARQVTHKVGRYVSRAIYNLIMSYDVDVIALGGGVSHAGEDFFGPVRQELDRMAEDADVVRVMLRGMGPGEGKVILLPKEADPAGRGVIALAMQSAAPLDQTGREHGE